MSIVSYVKSLYYGMPISCLNNQASALIREPDEEDVTQPQKNINKPKIKQPKFYFFLKICVWEHENGTKETKT